MAIPNYEEVVRKPNKLKNLNPLKNTIATVVDIETRIKELLSYKKWTKLMESYQTSGIKFSPSLRPMIKMVKLGLLLIAEDIREAFEANPQNMVETIRERGKCFYSAKI